MIELILLFRHSLFQFHKGTIKTDGHIQAKRSRRNFNSIKVQLKLRRNGKVFSDT